MNKKNFYWLIVTITVCLLLYSIWLTVFSGNYSYSNEQDIKNNNIATHEGKGPAQSNSAPQADDQNLKNYLHDEKSIMEDMMKGMHDITHSQNASIDFLAGMIPHHESAIAMAESYLKLGAKDPRLKKIAEEIKVAQIDEIREMNSMIQSIESSGAKDATKEKAYLEKYNAMMAQHHAVQSSGSTVDEAFANGMIIHHQMAVEMARAILDYTDEKSVKNLATSIIKTQEREISEMNNILDRLKLSSK